MPIMQSFAVVLTGAPGAATLDAATIEAVRLQLTGREVIREHWLAPGDAWEALLVAEETTDVAPLKGYISAALGSAPIDVNIIADEPAPRRKKLLVADMESTIIEQECLDELAGYLGLRPKIADITERAMRGELNFEAAIKERVALLKGLNAGVLDDLYANRVTLMPGAETLIATMRANGAYCALVSGGFRFFTEKVAARLSFDVQQANQLDIVDGRIAGTVAEPILGREAKLAALERLARERGLKQADTLAVGDGANDLAMIGAAGLGVAFRAKPVVAASAAASITHGDLTALLYLQGYRWDEFVPAVAPQLQVGLGSP
jgi:phosphoserine phosphatase